MLATIPLGSALEASTVHDSIRTPEARATVLAIAARAEFRFASNNPFDEFNVEHMAVRGRNHTGPFWFLWHDTTGELHASRIGKAGNVLRELTGSEAARAR
ncbi:hypothetical protein [Microtetraspora malaysiensis]|uniref:Uncharacterized protein n=1 Tax=Microtetraspora malaysiensis TaxID=161358 RepID=A0ABW6SMP9_9ACTN